MAENHDDVSSISITQTDYENYSTILFQINALKAVFNQEAQLLKEESINNFYCDLLIKKYQLDVYVFNSNPPKASKNIDTKSELRRAQQNRAANWDQGRNQIIKSISNPNTPQDTKSNFESAQDWLIFFTSARLKLMPGNLVLRSNSEFKNSTSLLGGIFLIANFTSILNALASLAQAIAHQRSRVTLNGANKDKTQIKTSGTIFLAPEKYDLYNDFTLTINTIIGWDHAFNSYQNFQSIKDAPSIKDAFSGFIFTNSMSTVNSPPLAETFIVVFSLINLAIGIKKYYEKKAQFEELINKMNEDRTLMEQQIMISALIKQQEKKLKELLKENYLNFMLSIAMSILLLAKLVAWGSLNLSFVGAILGFVARICLLISNFNENTKDLSADSLELKFKYYEFEKQLQQQMSFVIIFLILFLAMPHGAPTLAVSLLLICLCVVTVGIINHLLQKQIDNHPNNPMRKIDPIDPSPELDRENPSPAPA